MLRLLIVLFALQTASANAQVATLRSGEHAGFSRLVLTFPAAASWLLGRTGDGYGLRAAPAGLRFDLSTVFDRIPRSRIVAAWVDPQTGVLRLGLGCVCHARTELFRNNVLVLDIVDGPAPPGARHETTLENAGLDLPGVGPVPRRPKTRPRDFLPSPPAVPVAAATIRPPSPPLPTLPSDRALDLERSLVASLRQGIATGVVEPSPAGRRPDAAVDEGRGPRRLPLAGPGASRGPDQLRLVDPAAAGNAGLGAAACVLPERLDLAAWAGPGPAAIQMADARRDLLGEFDRPDPDRLLALVRLHLHYGFGAEARSLLTLGPVDAPDRDTLLALATLVDGEESSAHFVGMAGCDGPAALWSMIAAPTAARLHEIDRLAVLRTFSGLPTGLRRHLGPGLVQRFLELGDSATARSLRDAIDRTGGDGAGIVSLMDAEFALREGRVAAADLGLAHLAAEDRRIAPMALATLVASRARRGLPASSGQLIDLEAIVVEHRGRPESSTLRQAFALGLVVSGGHDRAFREIAAEEPAVLADLWATLVEHGSDVAFAEIALSPLGHAAERMPLATRLATGARLIDLGFPDAGLRWLPSPGPDQAAMLRARAALGKHDGRMALRQIASLTGLQAEGLRARALELIGDPGAAAQAWIAAGDPGQADRLHYVAREWDAVDVGAHPALARLRELREPTQMDARVGPLAAGRSLLLVSQDAREQLESLLTRSVEP